MTLIRSSIIFLYIRIFPMRWLHITGYSVVIFNAVFFVAMVLSNFLAKFIGCQRDSEGYCSSSNNVENLTEVLALAFNLLLDVVVVILPIPKLWRLQIPISKKMMLSGMFALGIIICAMTAVRLEIVNFYYIDPLADLVAYDSYFVLAYFEPVVSVITACLPVLKPVFNKAHHSIKRIGGRLAIRSFLESGSIPIVMRVSQMWNSVSAQRAERDGMNSIVPMEDWRRVQTETGSTSQAERPEGVNLPDIHVQKDIHIEITSDDDRIGAQNV